MTPFDVQGRNPRWRKREAADVFRMKAVDVLARIDAIYHGVRVEVRRQRQLDQDAVNLRIAIQLLDQGNQFCLCRRRRQIVVARTKADMRTSAALVAHVDGRCRLVADQDNGKPGHGQPLLLAQLHPRAKFVEQVIRDALAVQYSCGHPGSSLILVEIGSRRDELSQQREPGSNYR